MGRSQNSPKSRYPGHAHQHSRFHLGGFCNALTRRAPDIRVLSNSAWLQPLPCRSSTSTRQPAGSLTCAQPSLYYGI